MLIGHQKQWQFLTRAAELGKIPHGFLFFGEAQLGKKTLALEFIKLLNCEMKDFSEKPCQICRSCRSLQKREHPDVAVIEPEKKEIEISQIRELIWKLSLRPFAAPFKAGVIDQAHCLNREAQSCFLKTLEEPKGKVLLILITEYPEMLFPTILSRVQKIRFSLVPKSAIEDYLKNQGISSQEVRQITSFSFGKPGLAINLFSDPQKLENQNQRIREIEKISQADLSFRFQYIKDLISQKQNLKEILDIWLRYFRDVLLQKAVKYEKEWSYRPPLSGKYSLTKLKDILRLIQSTNFLISTTNVNPRLALEVLMLELSVQGSTLHE